MTAAARTDDEVADPEIDLLSPQGKVLASIAGNPDATVEELADRLTLSNRTVRRRITELERAGALSRIRQGNRNRYQLHRDAAVAGPGALCTVGDFLDRIAHS